MWVIFDALQDTSTHTCKLLKEALLSALRPNILLARGELTSTCERVSPRKLCEYQGSVDELPRDIEMLLDKVPVCM